MRLCEYVLYEAIAQKLASGCHYERGTKFYLEGQSAVLQKKSLPIKFMLAIEAPEPRTGERNLRHEIHIEVLEDRAAEPNLQQRPEQSIVKFDLPDSPKPPDPLMTEVENLCLSLDQMSQYATAHPPQFPKQRVEAAAQAPPPTPVEKPPTPKPPQRIRTKARRTDRTSTPTPLPPLPPPLPTEATTAPFHSKISKPRSPATITRPRSDASSTSSSPTDTIPGHEQAMEQVDHGGRDARAGEARTTTCGV
ncbi:MAG: hypothetical protein Q9175_001987 [Cornicularia normoerica]